MERLPYITWIDLDTNGVIPIFTISELNREYNESEDVANCWQLIYDDILNSLEQKEVPTVFEKYFKDNLDSIQESWWDLVSRSNPYGHLRSKASELLSKERKEFAFVIYNKLKEDYGLCSTVANIVLSGAGPVLATVAIDWVMSCGEALKEDNFTDLEVYDIIHVAAAAPKIGNFGKRRHLKVIEAFGLPEIPVSTGAAFRKITSVAEPIAASIYQKRHFIDRYPDKTYEYREPSRNTNTNSRKLSVLESSEYKTPSRNNRYSDYNKYPRHSSTYRK